MSILPQLEHDLLAAARRIASKEEGVGEGARRGARVWFRTRVRTRALRVPAVALGALLASATIALAATGVILTGTPVSPSDQQNPTVGDGVPAPGASVLLPLRVADPEGGLPWGMRIVHTTRGKICLQVGRVKDGQLGELGIDGAFGDDGRFHPLPASALPPLTPTGLQPSGDANTSCNLAEDAIVGSLVGLDRSASALPVKARTQLPSTAWRDISFGILGPDAVSVTYSESSSGSGGNSGVGSSGLGSSGAGSSAVGNSGVGSSAAGGSSSGDSSSGPVQHSLLVTPESGAYLIVQRSAPGEQAAGYASISGYGEAVPSAPLTAISYRIDGKLCERVPARPPGTTGPTVANPCPQPQPSDGRSQTPPAGAQQQAGTQQQTGAQQTGAQQQAGAPPQPQELHIPLHVQLQVHEGLITGMDVSFAAPYAVTDATHEYAIRIPECVSPTFHGFAEESLDHNVARGATVQLHLGDPFIEGCGRGTVERSSANLQAIYRHADGGGQVVVGSTTVTEPPGTKAAPADSRR